MVVNLLIRMFKPSLVSPSWSHLKGGSQAIEVARQRFYVFKYFIWKICYSFGGQVPINHKYLCSRLVTLCTNEFRYSSRLVFTLSYYQREVQLSTYPRQVDINDIGKGYRTSTDDSSESYETLLFHHAWLVSFEWTKFSKLNMLSLVVGLWRSICRCQSS